MRRCDDPSGQALRHVLCRITAKLPVAADRQPGRRTGRRPAVSPRPPRPGIKPADCRLGTTAGFRGRTGSGHTASLPATTSAVPTSRGAGVRAEYTAPVLVVAESVSLKPVAGASSVNSRLPRPTVTGKTSSRYSSIRPARCIDRARAQLPWICSSPPGPFFSSVTCSMTLPDSTVVPCHFGSRNVLDTTYFGCALSLTPAVLPGSVTCDQ